VSPTRKPTKDTSPGDVGSKATSPVAAPPTAPTRIEAGYGGPGEPPRRKRSPWTIPLIVLIVLLAILLIAGLVNAFASGQPSGTPSRSVAAPTSQSATPKSSASVTSSTITVNSSDYIGKPYRQVVSALAGLGLKPRAVPGSAATSEAKVETVGKLDPTGSLEAGDSIDVFYYTATATPDAPSSAPSVKEPQPVPGDSDITISWPAYRNCPSGTKVTGYSAAISGSATPSGDQFLAAGRTSTTLHTGAAGSDPITVKYKVFCGAKDSGYSPKLTIELASGDTGGDTSTVQVDKGAYVGKAYTDVVADLKSKGLTTVNPVEGTDPPSPGQAGQVYDVTPNGSVKKSDPVTVTYYKSAG
jgi:hypothetical protein